MLNHAGIISGTFRFDIKPLYELPLLAEFRSTCINATNHCRSVLTIPTHEGLEDADRGRIIETLHGLTAN